MALKDIEPKTENIEEAVIVWGTDTIKTFTKLIRDIQDDDTGAIQDPEKSIDRLLYSIEDTAREIEKFIYSIPKAV